MAAPLSPYGRAKMAMEADAAAHPHPSTVLRISNLAGADAILAGWRPGFALDRFADGRTPARSYIGPLSFARVLRALAGAQGLPAVLNVAAPGPVEMGVLLDAAALPWTPRPATEATVPRVHLDTGRLAPFVSIAPEAATPAGIVAEWQAVKDRL